MNDLPVLDPKPLNDLLGLGAGMELIRELIGLYEEDLPSRMSSLRAAAGASDAGEIAAEAHQMKGALGNLGLARFADLAMRIEVCAKEGRLEEAVPLIDTLPALYDASLKALNAAFPAR